MASLVISALPVPITDAALAQAERHTADGPGYPCRRCMRDAEAGEDLLLVRYYPFATATAWTASGPIWIHARACSPAEQATAVPEQLRRRVLSMRAFDAAHVLVDAALTPGSELETAADKLLSRADVAFLHIHFAAPGCFAARVDRAGVERQPRGRTGD